MENNNIIIKVYSNNSKKSRLKRKKSKFYRVWDPETQTYVKRRRPGCTVKTQTKRTEKDDYTTRMETIKRRQTSKKAKIKPQEARKSEPARIVPKTHAKALGWPKTTPEPEVQIPLRRPSEINMCGQKLIWNSDELRYKIAA